MSNIVVPNNSDQTPNRFLMPTFIPDEAPTSDKFNAFGQFVNTQFGIMSEAVGNPFVHGIPNMGGAIGQLSKLTQPQQNSNNLVGIPAPIYNPQLTVNECQAIVGTIQGNGLYPITLVGGVIGTNNIITNPGPNSFSIVNVAIVTKDNNGNINEVFPGTFIPQVGYISGPISQFQASFGDVILPGNNFYAEIINYSISDVLNIVATNQGNMSFGRALGYTDGNDNIQTIPGTNTPTITAEINADENKVFALKWHAVLTKATASSSSGGNYTWNATAASNTWQSGSSPTGGVGGQVSQYIATMTSSLIVPALTVGNSVSYASIQGAVLMTTGGAVVVPTITYSAGTLSIVIPTAQLSNVGNSTPIDVYFSAGIPYRLLGSSALSYTDVGSRMPDLFAKVIGYQYGWANPTYPNTIANRLDADEATISAQGASISSLAAIAIPNGSFDSWAFGQPIQWTSVASANGAASISQDTTTQIHGSSAVSISTGSVAGLGGGMSLTTQSMIPISPQSTFYLKFKTKASIAGMTGNVTVNFFQAGGGGAGSFVLWSPPSSVWPTSWTTAYGVIADYTSSATIQAGSNANVVTIPLAARFMTITTNGGTNGGPANQTVEFDGFEFFSPGKTGYIISTNTPGTSTFVTPGNCTSILVTMIGAGGGGAGGGQGSYGAGGGGGTGAIIKTPIPVIPDTTYTIIVGTGGGGGTQPGGGGPGQPSGGSPGGQTQLKNAAGTILVSASGGAGGNPSSGGLGPPGGSGGNGGAVVVPSALSSYTIIMLVNGTTGNNALSGNQAGGNGGQLNYSYPIYIVQLPGFGGQYGGGSAATSGANGTGGGGGANGFFNYSGGSGGNGLAIIEF